MVVLVLNIETYAISSSGHYWVINKSLVLTISTYCIIAPAPPLMLSSSLYLTPFGVLFSFWTTLLPQSILAVRGWILPYNTPSPYFRNASQEGAVACCLYFCVNESQYWSLLDFKSKRKSTLKKKICFGLLVDLSIFFISILPLKRPLKYRQKYVMLNANHSYHIIGLQ